MSDLAKLINRLQRGITNNATYIKNIRYPTLLVRSLQELSDIVGNDKIKNLTAKQTSYLISSRKAVGESGDFKEDNILLNTVIYGASGVGKSLIAAKLAKIWHSLGYLDGNKAKRKDEAVEKIPNKPKTWTFNTNDTLVYYLMFIFLLVFIFLMTISPMCYERFGIYWIVFVVGLIIVFVVAVGFYISTCEDPSGNPQKITEFSEDMVIKFATRADFVDRHLGSTKKVNKLLEDNLGKVLFVDEAYSLITDVHDSFGIEILTAINLFLEQHPKEIIVIFAGYKDLLNAGIFAVQPELRKKVLWQLECEEYNSEQLLEIFKVQLRKIGWSLTDEIGAKHLFMAARDSFPAYGDNTERLVFLAKLEHSNDFVANEFGNAVNLLTTEQIKQAIAALKDDNKRNELGDDASNVMNIFRSGRRNVRKTDVEGKKKDDSNFSQNASENDSASANISLDANSRAAIDFSNTSD